MKDPNEALELVETYAAQVTARLEDVMADKNLLKQLRNVRTWIMHGGVSPNWQEYGRATALFIKFLLQTTITEQLLSMRVMRAENTIFMRLPRELWRSCGICKCEICQGSEGFWDTLAVSTMKGGGPDFTWTVHHPEG